MTYILYTNGVLEQDGFHLPTDELNPDYQAFLVWIALGNQPESRPGSEYLAKLEEDKQLRLQIRTEYQAMLTRLNQIQTASNPTNAQIIQAIKDEALYIERIIKFLKNV